METKVRTVKETLPPEAVRSDVSAVTVEQKRKDDGSSIGVIKGGFTDDTVTLNRVRERAYQIWAESGFPDGQAVEHWLQAEQEITAGVSG
jgi:hypothetical protein